MDQVCLEQLDEMEIELFDTGVLGTEEIEPQMLQSSSEREQRSDVMDRVDEAPVRRNLHPRRRLGPVNQAVEMTSGTSRSEATRDERRPDRSSLMWSRPIASPWDVYKEHLMKLNLQTVKFAADRMRMLNGKKLSVNGLYSILGVD